MPATEAQIRANQANAARSTGPKTEEGKAQSRRNALKHGLTGEGIVLPEADAAEVLRKAAAYRAELNPSGELGRDLVDQAAFFNVRMKRCADQQTAALAERVRQVEAEFEAPQGVDDPEVVAKLRAEAVRRAMFDPSKEATLIRKYEAAAQRGYFRALNEFRKIERAARKVEQVPDEVKFSKELGSYLAMNARDAEYEKLCAEIELEERKPVDLAKLRAEAAAFLDQIAPGTAASAPTFTIGRTR